MKSKCFKVFETKSQFSYNHFNKHGILEIHAQIFPITDKNLLIYSPEPLGPPLPF